MSHNYYNELWLTTREDLEKLLELDRRIQEGPPVKKIRIALYLALLVYLKYRNLVKKLVICFDQVVQTQKRELIKRVLDSAIGRMLEYKGSIVKILWTDYQWPDHILNQLKFTPDDVEICSPRSNKEAFEERRNYIQELLDNANKPVMIRERSLSQLHIENLPAGEDPAFKLRAARKKKGRVESLVPAIPVESAEEKAAKEARIAAEKRLQSAITLIQSHERARKARIFALDAKRLYDYSRKIQSGEIVPKKIDKASYKNAAVTIQRAWRKYLRKKAINKRLEQLENILNMTMPSRQSGDLLEEDEKNFELRMKLMPLYAAGTEKAISSERTRLLRDIAPGLTEDVMDEIREWFLIWYKKVGYFDEYPAKSLGGSIPITAGETLTPEEYLAQKGQKKKDSVKTPAKKEEKAKGKSDDEFSWRMTSSQAFTLLEEANRDFNDHWSLRDERNNPLQNEYLDLITEKLCYELQFEVREVADEFMRGELNQLNKALIKDVGKDKNKLPMLEKKKKHKNGENTEKKGKRKKGSSKDNVPIEEQFNELVQAKIIRNYPLTSLKEWIGDLSYQNYEAQREFREYTYRMGEVKQVIMEYCILPLTSREVHEIAPLTRSVCIFGLPRCGKSLLANAICTEVGAIMFDMTPQILVGKYTGKKNQQKLIDMVLKVAKVYAPSVIFIDGGEKPWLKTVPPEERHLQPKRFAKYYPKLVKSIKPGDQILFLTISSEPYKASKPFIKIHDKFIMIPLTDYNTLYMYYKDLLMKYHGVDRNIDVSCLAKMSVGIPLEFIRQAVENVLNIRRRIRLKFNPLGPQEIFEELMTYTLPTGKVVDQLEKFETRTPMGKKRKNLLNKEKEMREQLKAQQAKQKKSQK